jgi:hypothetical protein
MVYESDAENCNRTLKASVKDELTIPQQTRYLVNIAMGPVEKHVGFFQPSMSFP